MNECWIPWNSFTRSQDLKNIANGEIRRKSTRWAPMIVINGVILPPINGLTSRGFPGLSYFTPNKSSDFTPRITNDRLGLGPPKIWWKLIPPVSHGPVEKLVPKTQRIHGTNGIFTDMWLIFMVCMQVNIPVPWILWETTKSLWLWVRVPSFFCSTKMERLVELQGDHSGFLMVESYCWWKKEIPNNNHRLDGAKKTLYNNWINYLSLNWWVYRISGCHQQ